jgi:tetraacyldisaccharide 4'-kinase
MRRQAERAEIPVVCVGNFTAGGAGKTPTVLMIADALAEKGERPFIVSRGYGGTAVGPLGVDPMRHTAADCGDEPLLLARKHPVIVARDRRAGAELAARKAASVIILDDGLQSNALARDFTLAVIDAGVGVGNGFCVPAGPLRAPLLGQLPHVDAVFILGAGDAGRPVAAAAQSAGLPVFAGCLEPYPEDIAALRGRKLLAFAGIGRPAKFVETLRAAGLGIDGTRAFADHQPYTESLAGRLISDAEAAGLTLVTTEKDVMRWPARLKPPRVVRVRASSDDRERLVDLILTSLRARRSVI